MGLGKTKRIKKWCKINNTHLGCTNPGKKIRCPDCNKQLKVFSRECDDAGCYHFYMPKHKKLTKK